MAEPRFKLYSDAKCVSQRRELAGIHDVRVGVIRRSQRDDGHWEYTVSPHNSYCFYVCDESELVPAVPLDLFADDKPFPTIRRALSYGLYQDWDSRFGSLAEALLESVKSVDPAMLRSELSMLVEEPEENVREVLDDNVVNIMDLVTPHDLLVTLQTLASLM
jgi:hypothetical protein